MMKTGTAILIALILTLSFSLKAENLKVIRNLEGSWRFTIGDDPAWAATDYDHSRWDLLYVPGSWEQSGFIDYNGYAWYRKEFYYGEDLDQEHLFLMIGQIDDVDEVYLNGVLIGNSGVFPPLVRTAYNLPRKYPFPNDLLNKNGKNVIAVRVHDEYLDGGIYAGPVGIYRDIDNELLSLNLAGYWDFETTNKTTPINPEIYKASEGKIYVPAYWESMGYPEYDGSAVYSTEFRLPARFDTDEMMIVLGYIDDVDKVDLNGIRIGTVTDLRKREGREIPDHLILRGYEIPAGVLKPGAVNTLVVKVYDTGIMGGIYEGPIGLITEQNFRALRSQQVEKPYNFWDSFFKQIFE